MGKRRPVGPEYQWFNAGPRRRVPRSPGPTGGPAHWRPLRPKLRYGRHAPTGARPGDREAGRPSMPIEAPSATRRDLPRIGLERSMSLAANAAFEGAALGACNGGAWDMRWGQFVAAIAAA